MEQNSRKTCSMCGKKFDMWDEQENFCFVRHIGYGSKYDMMGLYLNLCCDCFDKIADWFLPLCVQNPLRDEEDCWHAFSPGVSDALFFHKQLLGQMKDSAKQLCAQLEGISADDSDFRLQLLKAADALSRFSDYGRAFVAPDRGAGKAERRHSAHDRFRGKIEQRSGIPERSCVI